MQFDNENLNEFWEEGVTARLIKSYEQNYLFSILRNWTIVEIITRPNQTPLIKWTRRIRPLTDEELKEQYGK